MCMVWRGSLCTDEWKGSDGEVEIPVANQNETKQKTKPQCISTVKSPFNERPLSFVLDMYFPT